MTHALYLLDPDPSATWAPFAGSRPISELRAGAQLIRERWEAFAGTETTAVFALPHLAGFVEPGAPLVCPRRAVTGPAVLGSSTFVPRGLAPPLPAAAFRLVCQGVTVGWGVGPGATWDGPQPNAVPVEVSGVVLRGAFDLVGALERRLVEDLAERLSDSDPIPAGSTVLGDPAWVVVHDAAVEPGVLFDVRQGPVVLESGVEVRSGTRLEGPVWAGANSHVLGGAIRATAIGPHCKVRGELMCCVFLGYANKAHEGFVGHSVIGRWANIGAGTITSNLKNTYGTVRLDVAGAAIETGLMNLGSLIGDHAKTAIGTLLGTGSVIGFGANVFGAVRPPKYVPPLAWGVATDTSETGERLTKEGFLKIAARVLPRRDVPVDDATRTMLAGIYDWASRSSRL